MRKIEFKNHSKSTIITDTITILTSLIIALFSRCSVDNIIPCAEASVFIIIIIIIKYFKTK